MLGVGIGAFGAGALARSLKELPSVLGHGTPTVTTGPALPVEVPIPQDPNEEQQPKPMLGGMLPKMAGPTDMIGNMAGMAYDNVLKPTMEAIDPVKATNPWAKWWTAPAMAGAGLAAGGAGWKLVDWMADKRRDVAGDADLQAAKQEYENAVRGLHAKTADLDAARQKMLKHAHPDGVSEGFVKAMGEGGGAKQLFDSAGQGLKNMGNQAMRLADQYVGQPLTRQLDRQVDRLGNAIASITPPSSTQPSGMDSLIGIPGWDTNALRNYGGLTLGGGASLAALTGFPTAYFAYNHTRNNSDTKALQEALMARRRAQQLRNPAPPHLVLAPPAA